MRRLKEYIGFLDEVIVTMKAQGKETDCLERNLKSMKAIYPNKKTRIDLHDVFLKEAEQPIYPLYCTKFEIYCIQVNDFVPDKGTPLWNSLQKSYYIEHPDAS